MAAVNGDGKPDIVAANLYSDNISVLLGNGKAAFVPVTASPFSSGGVLPRSTVVADINHDGKPDLVVANVNLIEVFLGNGDGGFSLFSAATGNHPTSMLLADVNGDGNLDLVFTDISNVNVFVGDGVGNFIPAANSPFATGGTNPKSVAVADVNHDG